MSWAVLRQYFEECAEAARIHDCGGVGSMPRKARGARG
jgi:hypothetical protein